MKSSLSEEMKSNIKNAVIDQDMAFKYSPAYDIHSVSREPAEHRVMCKGQKTQNKWVWLGNTNCKPNASADVQGMPRWMSAQLALQRMSEA